MAKIDFRKELKPLYSPSARAVAQVSVPPLRYLMVDGAGDPNVSVAYRQAVEALFSVSYAVKFAFKRGPLAIDYGVMPLEGLWWADDFSAFAANDRGNWKWTMVILQPAFVSEGMISSAMTEAGRKRSLPALAKLRMENFSEGLCAQILHVGPFSEEGPTIARLHAFIEARTGLTGKHHEIYLSDVRRANPAKWRTILRQPMKEG